MLYPEDRVTSQIADLLAKAVALHRSGRLFEAEACYREMLRENADHYDALYLLATLCAMQGRHAEARNIAVAALAIQPQGHEALAVHSLALHGLGEYVQALAGYNRVLAQQPGSAAALHGHGRSLLALGRHDEALTSLDAALAARPHLTSAHVDRGEALAHLGRADDAIVSFDRALALAPDDPRSLLQRSRLLWETRQDFTAARRDLDRLLTQAPDYPFATGQRVQLALEACDWDGLGDMIARVDIGVRAGMAAVTPFVYQAIAAHPGDLLRCATLYTDRLYPAAAPRPHGMHQERIRIGYLSGEFRAQATAYLAAGLYEHHDRSQFKVIAFDNGRDDSSPMRRRLEHDFDRMIDISALGSDDAADRIAAEDIDILVNLNGYFGAARMDVFARRPAPVQVNYLGFPGTLGAPYIDYIIADRTVIPDAEACFYSEAVAWLPHSYQINDSLRAIAPQTPSRADCGLPQDGVVFCHFNQSYKLTPAMFAIWMRILRAVPGSVLWLLQTNSVMVHNLRRQAAQADVEPQRLVFAQPAPIEAHLARLRCGDLFLDSLPYNAHTTASDTLWAGLPILTCRGTTFPGRVAASLLKALGLPELITETPEEYEALAVQLARDTARHRALRARLAVHRDTHPLFDTALTCRHIERAYIRMWERHRTGAAPQSFAVEPAA